MIKVIDMFGKNERVLYGAQGVCTVSDIRCDGGREYYVLTRPASAGTTIFVPTDNPVLTQRLRPLPNAAEARRLIETVPADAWLENESARRDRYRKALADGDPAALLRLVRSVYRRRSMLAEQHKKPHSCDEQFCAAAERLLRDALAGALGVSDSDFSEMLHGVV